MKADLAAIVALVAILGSGVGWIISVESRLANRIKTETYHADQMLVNSTVRGDLKTMKTELDTDIRSLRDRLNEFQCPPCPIASK